MIKGYLRENGRNTGASHFGRNKGVVKYHSCTIRGILEAGASRRFKTVLLLIVDDLYLPFLILFHKLF